MEVNKSTTKHLIHYTIFTASFQCLQSFYGVYTSFEYLCAVIKCCPRILLLTVYRPPNLPAAAFILFCELLSVICVLFDNIVISGDFNIHVDSPDSTHARDFLALIDTFNLIQHIQGPTHSQGHTLDLVITKDVTVSTSVVDLALSDHSCIFFEVCMSPYNHNSSIMIRKRAINDNTCVLFEQALLESTSPLPQSADDLLENFNIRMTHIMDDIAPSKLRNSTSKQKAPWMNDQFIQLNCLKKNVGEQKGNGENPNSTLTIKSIMSPYTNTTP